MTDKNISQKIQILFNHFNAKNFSHVISKGIILIKKNPEYVILYNLIGSSYQNLGEYLKAKTFFKNGLKLDNKNIALMNNLAMSYKNLLQYDLAEKLYFEILEINEKYLNAYINLGNLKRDLNKFDEAIKLYEKAATINDKSSIVYYSLALAHQGIGNFEKTINYSQKALAIEPNLTRADHLISQSMKYNNKNKHFDDLIKKFGEIPPNSFEKVDLCFSLAKAEEDQKNYRAASEYLIKGNKLRKDLIKYDVQKDIELLENIKSKFLKFKSIKSDIPGNEKVIFILGMPRSGTSLVEQIITSHSRVFGGGELPILSNIIKNNFIDENGLLIKDMEKFINETHFLNKLKKDYENFINIFQYKEKYITDKAPLNFRWIGFIKLILPNAKIIHCIRDPKNNCLSMFKNLFEGGLNFTYDQNDLIKYFKQYQVMMNFWTEKFGEKILHVNYENLVTNNVKEIKKIIKFCDLEWEENCLSFHKNKTPIKTMSSSQARNPIYKSSINTFDKFKDYLTIIDKGL